MKNKGLFTNILIGQKYGGPFIRIFRERVCFFCDTLSLAIANSCFENLRESLSIFFLNSLKSFAENNNYSHVVQQLYSFLVQRKYVFKDFLRDALSAFANKRTDQVVGVFLAGYLTLAWDTIYESMGKTSVFVNFDFEGTILFIHLLCPDIAVLLSNLLLRNVKSESEYSEVFSQSMLTETRRAEFEIPREEFMRKIIENVISDFVPLGIKIPEKLEDYPLKINVIFSQIPPLIKVVIEDIDLIGWDLTYGPKEDNLAFIVYGILSY